MTLKLPKCYSRLLFSRFQAQDLNFTVRLQQLFSGVLHMYVHGRARFLVLIIIINWHII